MVNAVEGEDERWQVVTIELLHKIDIEVLRRRFCYNQKLSLLIDLFKTHNLKVTHL